MYKNCIRYDTASICPPTNWDAPQVPMKMIVWPSRISGSQKIGIQLAKMKEDKISTAKS